MRTVRRRAFTPVSIPTGTGCGLARWILPLILIVWLTGCTTTPVKGRADLLAFLVDGTTTRETVLLQLGQPSGRFEHEKILTYRLGYEEKTKHYWLVERENSPTGWPTWLAARFSLVLVFDEQGVLRKHSLVEVN
jgi:hypothetical protein